MRGRRILEERLGAGHKLAVGAAEEQARGAQRVARGRGLAQQQDHLPFVAALFEQGREHIGIARQAESVIAQVESTPQGVRQEEVADATVGHKALVHASDEEQRRGIPGQFQPALEVEDLGAALGLDGGLLQPRGQDLGGGVADVPRGHCGLEFTQHRIEDGDRLLEGGVRGIAGSEEALRVDLPQHLTQAGGEVGTVQGPVPLPHLRQCRKQVLPFFGPRVRIVRLLVQSGDQVVQRNGQVPGL